MRLPYSLLALILVNLAALDTAVAIPVDLTSGTTTTANIGQSFNETRGVTATVLGGIDLELLSMTVSEFNIFLPGGTVGARVYADSGALLASADAPVPTGTGQTVTIPILATLAAGDAYRFAFFVSDFQSASTTLFDPIPSGFALTPYVDLSGLFRISATWALPSDAFPTNISTSLPHISLEVQQTIQQVPELGVGWLLASALLCVTALAYRNAPRSRRRTLASLVGFGKVLSFPGRGRFCAYDRGHASRA